MRWVRTCATATMVGSMAVLFSTSCTSSQAGDEVARIARCAAMMDADRRLHCYDELVRRLQAAEAGQDSTVDPGWTIDEVANPKGSTRELSLKVPGDREARGKGVTTIPRLIIRCADGRMEAYVETGMPAQQEYGGEGKTVILRFDEDDVFKDRLAPGADGTTLGFSSSEMLVNQLLLHDSFYFQFTPRNSGPTSTNFDLRGLVPLFRSVESVCGFTLDGTGLLVPLK